MAGYRNRGGVLRQKAWAIELGSGTVLAVGLIGLLVATLGVLQIPMRQLVLQARAQTAADQAAIAGADALRGLSVGIPCDVARLTVIQNQATIAVCRVVGNSVYVSVRTNPLIVAESLAGI